MKSLPGLIWLIKSWLQNLSNSKEYKKLPLKQLYVCVCSIQFSCSLFQAEAHRKQKDRAGKYKQNNLTKKEHHVNHTTANTENIGLQ